MSGEKQKKKILFLIPDGTGIRNYLYSSILDTLIQNGHEVILWHNLTEGAFEEIGKIHRYSFKKIHLPVYKESVQEKFLRESASLARLRHNAKMQDNPTILTNWNPSKKNMKLKVFYALVEKYAQTLTNYDKIAKTEKKHLSMVKNSPYINAFREVLQTYRPDVIFNTHQRAILAIPAIEAAKEEGIETISAIYSWDNLPKARLNAKADAVCVWSSYMAQEMYRYYPEIDKNRVMITGTPQFEFYDDTSLYESKEHFCQKFDLDPHRKIICYSGDDQLTSPYDPEYLEDLAQALGKIPSKKRPQILLRRSPVDLSGRFDPVVSKYPDIIKVAEPVWKIDSDDTNNWSLVYPSMEDIKLLVNTALHCDMVYNVGSTMAHDFAIFDKPACYIRYDQPQARGWSVDTIYRFEHFKSMEGLDAVVWIESRASVTEMVSKVLSSPESVALDRKVWLKRITDGIQDASEKIYNQLTKSPL